MKTVHKILTSTGYHLYYSFSNPKIWAALLMMLAAVFLRIEPYAKVAADYNAKVSVGIISYIFSDGFIVTIVFAAFLFLFSELPFKNPQQVFLITRSGKFPWCVSQLLYIIVIVLTITSILVLFSVCLLIGHLSFDNLWGKVINTAVSNSELRDTYLIYDRISNSAIKSITPYKALAWSIPCGLLTYIVFGSIIYALNAISSKTAGIIGGVALIALHMLTGYIMKPSFIWLSPLEWSSITVINLNHISKMPTPEYSICVLLVLYILTIVLSFSQARKKSDIV